MKDDCSLDSVRRAVNEFVDSIEKIPLTQLGWLYRQAYFNPPCRSFSNCPYYVTGHNRYSIGCSSCPATGGAELLLRWESEGLTSEEVAARTVDMWRGFRDFVNKDTVRQLYTLRVGHEFHVALNIARITGAWDSVHRAGLTLLHEDFNRYLEDTP